MTTQKLKKINNTDLTNKHEKKILLLIGHPLCYSFIQSNLANVLAVIEERKHLRKR